MVKRRKNKDPHVQFCIHGINPKFCHACNRKPDSLSPDQRAAVNAVRSQNKSFFLTGSAGAGKSFVIDYIRSNFPGVDVTATTGAAAQLIQGRTLHSYAGIHPIYGVYRSHKVNERIRKCNVLIIDEASMLNEKLLEQLFHRFHVADHAPNLVLVGDFLQLPPVEGNAIFNSRFWKDFVVLKLHIQHRQVDGEFISVLNDIRSGNLTERAIKFLESRTVAELPDDCTHLMAHRATAEKRNTEMLNLLPGETYRSLREVSVLFNEKKGEPYDADISKARFVEELLLKENARVVLLTNEPEGQWVNGSTGTVEKVIPGTVYVNLDRGGTVAVGKVNEEIFDGDDVAVAIVRQYPIMLGWAQTIHRAQGATMDRVGVDLNGHFAPGQSYVALSRCRTAEGLFVKGELNRLIVDPTALKYCG